MRTPGHVTLVVARDGGEVASVKLILAEDPKDRRIVVKPPTGITSISVGHGGPGQRDAIARGLGIRPAQAVGVLSLLHALGSAEDATARRRVAASGATDDLPPAS